jgi:hypothetical protein
VLEGVSGRLLALPGMLRGSRTVLDNSPAYLALFDRAFRGEPFPVACSAGYTMMVVDSLGQVFSCWSHLEERRVAARLDGRRLREVWNAPEMVVARAATRTCRSCYWDCHAELSLDLPLL